MRGDLNPGAQLPTVRRLARELKVNFNTVARAYRLLDEAGIISTQQGRGTYIMPIKQNQALEKMQALDLETKQYLQKARSLGLNRDEVLVVFHRHFRDWNNYEQEKPNGKSDSITDVSRETYEKE